MECLISFCDNGCSRVSSIYLNIKFQSTLPYGERHAKTAGKSYTKAFQSTLPYGERRKIRSGDPAGKRFQSTLPYGERRCCAGLVFGRSRFQSTLPYGERLTSPPPAPLRAGFNPRSRMGSDQDATASMTGPAEFQSTLPYGERLERAVSGEESRKVSIHAPVWGATYLSFRLFSSTVVSIHAPVWGATINSIKNQRYNDSFNPRSRMGSDSTTM